ncbi:MAG: glutamine-synthetase adenylyltransferase [Sedimentitalea sp.]
MTFASSITRLPRPFDSDLGQDSLRLLPELRPELRALILGTAGTSPYLKQLIDRDGAWLAEAFDDSAGAVERVIDNVRALPADQLKPGLRLAKRRIALISALADLGGVWSLEQVTGCLSDFAALACDLAIKAEVASLIKRGKLPGQGPDDVAHAGGLVVLAMGKMGAGELNYSSDIDLICLFDETRYDPDDYHVARQGLVRATRNMCAILSDRTADGYVFRTDLRLRPDPAVTPVCMAMEAAERYYESLGRTWERAAYIKARAVAGDVRAGAGFLKTLRPFVWRRHLDFAAIQDAHDMRLRIRKDKGLGGPLTLPGHDMKLGRGGIREIEFFTQTRQLIAGGRDTSLRLRDTVGGLGALADKGWISADVASRLSAHYRAHRDVEHRIQMIHDAQTHKLPHAPEEFERIACLMGQDAQSLRTELTDGLSEVHHLTEGFFAPDATPPTPADDFDAATLARWRSYPALRSERAAQIFDRLRPELLARLARTARPDEALVALDGFLAGLPAGVQLFSLFEANPQLLDLLIDIVGTSHALARHLARNSGVFDAVIGGDFFAPWPGQAHLLDELTSVLAGEPDYESQLDAARRWKKEWQFRIGVHHLRGLAEAAQAGAHYGDLAQAVIAALLPVVQAQFAQKHGPAPGRGAAVLGMGSLGAGRLTATSDLDLIVIYDPQGTEMSTGARPLATRPYYARLTQALITALSAPMAQGRLYDVDMRLRPSGTQGPVATSLTSFCDYQQNQAWLWEHLALTRARVVASADPGLSRDIEDFRRLVLQKHRDRRDMFTNLGDMRARLEQAKTPDSLWDAKTGPGRMMDIELIAQLGSLMAAQSGSDTERTDVGAGLEAGVACGWIEVADKAVLATNYDLYWRVQTAARLLSAGPLKWEQMGEGGARFLCSSAGFDSLEALETALLAGYDATAAVIVRLLDGAAAP